MSLLSEIDEQPAVVDRIVHANREAVRCFVDEVDAHRVTHVVIAARGTSDNAARYAKYVWGVRTGLTVALAAPSLYGVYRRPPRLDGALVMAISQSGQSPDLVAVVEEARRQRRPTLVVTNDPRSPLAVAADCVIDLQAGPERAVAATKTFTAELAAIALVSAHMTGDAADRRDLETVPAVMADALVASESLAELAHSWASLDRCAVLGRGFHFAIAHEWALKLEELAHVLAKPFSTADFQHGPIGLVEPGFPILAVAAAGETLPEMREVLRRVRDLGAAPFVLSDDPDTVDEVAQGFLVRSALPEWLAPFPLAVAAQLFTYHLTVAKRLDPEAPRGLTKVTKTL